MTTHLRREAVAIFDNDELLRRAMIWLFERRYLLPNRRNLLDLARRAHRHREKELARAIAAAVPAEVRGGWIEALTAEVEEGGVSLFERLQQTPSSKNIDGLEAQAGKINCLKRLGAGALDLASLPLEVMRHYAGRAARRPARKLARIRQPALTIELACFLRLRLLEISDQVAQMADHRIAEAWRRAHEEAVAGEGRALARYQVLVRDLSVHVVDKELSDDEFRELARKCLADFSPGFGGNRTARTRSALAAQSKDLARILQAVQSMDVEIDDRHPASDAICVEDWRNETAAAEFLGRLGKIWRDAVDPRVERSAIDVAMAARAVLVKRGLRNGSIGVRHSLEHRAPESRLIPDGFWERDRARFAANLGVHPKSGAFVGRLRDGLAAAMEAFAEAVEAGEIRIKAGRMVVPRLGPDQEAEDAKPVRRALYERIGGAQFPEILVEIDAKTRFSWTLLRRAPRTEKELVTLYAAILALGSDLSPASVVRMIAGLDPESVTRIMQIIIDASALREASDAVEAYMRSHSVSALWGGGLTASADMMSLEASRHLWNTRTDPRRRTYAIGTYTHMLDQWGIIYDQPIILNKRQAGAAIEGALRQEAVTLERLAVDTHGYTHFAMALANLCGFDLCPRLAGLSKLKLYVPRGFEAPGSLRAIVSPSVSTRTIARGWDDLLRLAASVREGWCSATFILEKFGSAAKGSPAYEAGVGIGKLLRTIYLCDYLSNTDFRREIGRALNRGEAVHTLQRAIYARPMAPKTGRNAVELRAISNALTLLTNIVMAWNASRIQRVVDRSPDEWPEAALRHIAPVGHAQINMRGVMTFDLARHRHALLHGEQTPNIAIN